MRALITNDDGIDAPGLAALALVAAEAGLEVVVAAPAEEHSGASASIIATEGTAVTAAGGKGTVHTERRELPGIAEAHAVHAAPALIVLLALHGAFGPVPDVVLSGINRGANVGSAILHSGTVGAALTAGQGGVRALAVSLDVGLREGGGEHWETAAAVAARVLPDLLAAPAGTVLNLNAPDVAAPDGVELVEAPLAPFGIVQTTMTEQDGDDVRLAIRQHRADDAPGSDMERLAAGIATVTSVPTLVAPAR